jgi:hypothetical protein
MRLTLLVVLAAAAAGCTTTPLVPEVWTRSGATVGELTLDDLQCRRTSEMTGNGSGSGTYVGGLADAVVVTVQHVRREKTYAACMEAKGYTPVE